MDFALFKSLLAKCQISIRQVFGLEKRLSDLEAGGPGSAVWGSITGTLANQTDLNSALNGKTTIEAVQDSMGGGFLLPADDHLTLNYSDVANTLTLGVVPVLHFTPTGVEFGNTTQSYDVSGTTWVAAVAGGTLGGIPDETSAGHHLADCLTVMATSRDGAYLAVREASGAASATNPLTVHFLFSGITHFDSISLRSQYVGTVAHHIDIQLWNFNTSAWDTFADFSDESDYITRNIVVLSPAAYIDTGVVKLQYLHTSSGNTAHYLLFDYVGLSDGGSGSGGNVLASGVSFTPTGTIASTDVQSAIAEVAAEAGGGGGVIADTWANRPAASTEGLLFLPTDGYYPSRDTGAAWVVQNPLGLDCTNPPAVGTLTGVNTTAEVTLAADGDGLLFTLMGTGAATTKLTTYLVAAPAAPYTFTVGFDLLHLHPLSWGSLGLVLADGTLTTSETTPWYLGRLTSGLTAMFCQKFTNYAYAAEYDNLIIGTSCPGLWWMRIRDDNATRYYEYSTDRRNWYLSHSVGRTDFITPTHVGLCMVQSTGSLVATKTRVQAKIFDWTLA